jgi:hypothetical protein
MHCASACTKLSLFSSLRAARLNNLLLNCLNCSLLDASLSAPTRDAISNKYTLAARGDPRTTQRKQTSKMQHNRVCIYFLYNKRAYRERKMSKKKAALAASTTQQHRDEGNNTVSAATWSPGEMIISLLFPLRAACCASFSVIMPLGTYSPPSQEPPAASPMIITCYFSLGIIISTRVKCRRDLSARNIYKFYLSHICVYTCGAAQAGPESNLLLSPPYFPTNHHASFHLFGSSIGEWVGGEGKILWINWSRSFNFGCFNNTHLIGADAARARGFIKCNQNGRMLHWNLIIFTRINI